MNTEPKKQARIQWMGATVWVFDAETDQDLFSMAAHTPNLADKVKAKVAELGYEVEQVRDGRIWL
jgi:hypothetical protein